MHYAQAHAPKAPDGSTLDPNAAYNQMGEHVPGHPYVHDPAQANDFRARFHRPLVAPSPFRSAVVPAAGGPGEAPPPGSASAPPGGPPPPQGQGQPGQNGVEGDGRAPPGMPTGPPTIDPQLGQARDEAAGVAGKLERA